MFNLQNSSAYVTGCSVFQRLVLGLLHAAPGTSFLLRPRRGRLPRHLPAGAGEGFMLRRGASPTSKPISAPVTAMPYCTGTAPRGAMSIPARVSFCGCATKALRFRKKNSEPASGWCWTFWRSYAAASPHEVCRLFLLRYYESPRPCSYRLLAQYAGTTPSRAAREVKAVVQAVRANRRFARRSHRPPGRISLCRINPEKSEEGRGKRILPDRQNAFRVS